MSFVKKKSRSRWYVLPLFGLSVIVVGVAFLLYGQVVANLSAGDALLSARDKIKGEKIKSGQDGDVMGFLQLAKRSPHIKPWALLEEGSIYERDGDYEKALASYRQVSDNSAAALEASYRLLRIVELELPRIESPESESSGQVQTEPLQSEPLQTELVQSEPVQIEPVQIEPVQIEPVQIEHVSPEEPAAGGEIVDKSVRRGGRKSSGSIDTAKLLQRVSEEAWQMGRFEMLKDLEFIKARVAYAQGEYELAFSLYDNLRRKFSFDAKGDIADQEIEKLRVKFPERFPLTSAADLLRESEIMISARQNRRAKELLDKARTLVSGASDAIVDIDAGYLDLYRQQGDEENISAVEQRLFAAAASDASSATLNKRAQKSLLQLFRWTWTTDRVDWAKRLMGRSVALITSEPERAEVLYIAGRIREEEGNLSDAIEFYRQSVSISSGVPRLNTARRLAWSYFLNGDLKHAALALEENVEYLRGLEDISAKRLQEEQLNPVDVYTVQERRKLYQEMLTLRDERLHALYWSAEFRERARLLGAKTEANYTHDNYIVAMTKVESEGRFGYYGMLARNTLTKLGEAVRWSVPSLAGECEALATTRSRANYLTEPSARGQLAEFLGHKALADEWRQEAFWKRLKDRERLKREGKQEGSAEFEVAAAGGWLHLARYFAAHHNARPNVGVDVGADVSVDSYADSVIAAIEAEKLMIKNECIDMALLKLLYPPAYSGIIDDVLSADKGAGVDTGGDIKGAQVDTVQVDGRGDKVRIDRALVLSVMRRESLFDRFAKSSADARGLMQLMPRVAKDLGMEREEELYNPAVNIGLGVRLLGQLWEHFDSKDYLAIAAYNAGQTAVERWVQRNPAVSREEWIELIGFPETRQYVRAVLAGWAVYTEMTSVAASANKGDEIDIER